MKDGGAPDRHMKGESKMKNGETRDKIDDFILDAIYKTLELYGVQKEKTGLCYNAIRFECEARAVLLNRVPDRDNKPIGYYGGKLVEWANEVGETYVPQE